MTVEIATDGTLHYKVARTTAIVYFTAAWCQPCKKFSPIFEAVSNEVQKAWPGIGFYKVDIDESPISAEMYKIQSVPTVVILQNGSIIKQLKGAKSKRQLLLELADFI